jgi:uncharacterized damage-inducible protein DinB
MSAGELALHIASIPSQVIQVAQHDEVPAPDFGRTNPSPANVDEVLQVLEQGIADVRRLLPTFSDERMHSLWKMKKGDKEILAIPRVAVIRNIMLNHWYQHRGQFGVYLRLLGAKVPSSYGPSGDELPGFLES